MVAAGLSGVPSTVWALLHGHDVTEGAQAAGRLLLPRERRRVPLVAAAVPVHLVLSLAWSAVLAKLLPRRREPLWGAVAGLAIAVLDIGIIGRRLTAIRSLEQPPQWADHAAFGATVGLVLRARRLRAEPAAGHKSPSAPN
jgi:hypothetical protein